MSSHPSFSPKRPSVHGAKPAWAGSFIETAPSPWVTWQHRLNLFLPPSWSFLHWDCRLGCFGKIAPCKPCAWVQRKDTKSSSLKRQRILGDERISLGDVCTPSCVAKQPRDGILGKQGSSGQTENSILAKISSLWQQDIYGNMSYRDSLACNSTIYKTGLGLGPRIRYSPMSGFWTSF